MTAYRVNFVDKDDARSILLALLKQVTYPARSYADEHLYKVGTRNAEKGYIRLAGHGPCQQRLAGSRRSDQQNTFRDAPAELLELLRFAQELDYFAQLILGLIHSGHILERNFLLLHREQARPALTKRQGLVAARLHLPDHDEPQRREQDERSKVDQPRPASVLYVFDRDVDTLLA